MTQPDAPADPTGGAPMVGIIMGSSSDAATMAPAAEALARFGVSHEVRVISAHRSPHRMVEYATGAAGRGLSVIIAGAGGAAHLPGMVASMTTLPVIGVPVATMAIGGAENAGLMAVRMLALADPVLADALAAHAEALEAKAIAQDASLQTHPTDEGTP